MEGHLKENYIKNQEKNHILHDKKVSAIGRRYDRDKFLFQVNDLGFEVAVVNLTFSVKEENNNFPKIKLYKDLNDWINNCMIPDHYEFE